MVPICQLWQDGKLFGVFDGHGGKHASTMLLFTYVPIYLPTHLPTYPPTYLPTYLPGKYASTMLLHLFPI